MNNETLVSIKFLPADGKCCMAIETWEAKWSWNGLRASSDFEFLARASEQFAFRLRFP